MSKNIVIFGATSAIAIAVTHLYAKEGHRLYLIARNEEKLNKISKDLQIRYPNVILSTLAIDFCYEDNHSELIKKINDELSVIDKVLIAHGSLPNQKNCELSYESIKIELGTNLLSTISLLTHLSLTLQKQGHGTLAVITSVAGDRGRASNYIYGTAKGALDIFLQGLRNRLHKNGIHVTTIKPGLIDTPMTKGFKKGLLFSEPKKIANKIKSAIDKNKEIIYVPGYWFWIMLIIRLIPEKIFKRLAL